MKKARKKYGNWITDIEWYVKLRFTIMCAESLVNFFKRKYPRDDRPQVAIQYAKDALENYTPNAAILAKKAAKRARMAAKEAWEMHKKWTAIEEERKDENWASYNAMHAAIESAEAALAAEAAASAAEAVTRDWIYKI